ncbi:MAG: hypothetical protein U5N86_04815 [Planctomycetota bacterium]|nr:hypothetical protein [Planctomycetota bacterium]
MYQIYGNVVYNYGDTNNGSFYSYDYYTGAPIEFTVSSTPPAVTQMQAGYSLDGGTTWTQTVNGVLSDTQEKTYDFSWNTRDLVSDNVTLGVRTFAGTWCSWFAEGPIRVENKLYVSVTNNLGFGTVDVEGTEETVPFSGTWLYQTPYEVVAPQIVPSQSGETDVRYSFDTWSDLGSRAHDVELYWGDNPLISASYVKQVTVSVTTPYDQTQEFDGWLTTNNYYNFGVTSPHVIDSTTRYVCSGFTGTGSVPSSGDTCETGDFFLEDPSTVTFHWYAEYYFALTSEHSDDTGDLEGWYPTGTTLRCSATEIELLPASERWRTIGWTSTGSLAPGSGLDTGEFAITEPTTLTWLYDREVAIVVRANHGETDPDGRVWIRKGDQVYSRSLQTTPTRMTPGFPGRVGPLPTRMDTSGCPSLPTPPTRPQRLPPTGWVSTRWRLPLTAPSYPPIPPICSTRKEPMSSSRPPRLPRTAANATSFHGRLTE